MVGKVRNLISKARNIEEVQIIDDVLYIITDGKFYYYYKEDLDELDKDDWKVIENFLPNARKKLLGIDIF